MLETILILFCLVTFTGCSVDVDRLPKEESKPKVEENKKEEIKQQVPDILTIENSTDLKTLLESNNDDSKQHSDFCKKYMNKKIEFDGTIDLVGLIPGKTSRLEMLLRPGNFESAIVGPTMKFKDFSAADDGVRNMLSNGTLANGQNIHVIAKIDSYDTKLNVLFLKIVSINAR